MDKGKRVLHWGPWRKVFSVLQTGPRFTIHLSLWLCRNPPRVLRNRTRDPSPNGAVTTAEEKGGGAYRRRGCSGEGSGEVWGSLAITSRYGSSAMVVGVGRSVCAGRGARRRQGIRLARCAIVQSNGSGSFTKDQGRYAREEFENGSPDCSVYARPRVTEVRRGRSRISGEVLPGPRTWKASRATGEANRVTSAAWKWLGQLGVVAEAQAVMAGGGELAGVGVLARAWGGVKGRPLRTRGTYRRPREWLGTGAGDRSRPCAACAQRAATARPSAWARDRTRGSVILPEFNRPLADQNVHILPRILCSVSSPCQGLPVVCESRVKIWPGWEDMVAWRLLCQHYPNRDKTCVKRFGFDLKLLQSVPRVFWHHFDICTSRIWVLENREHIRTLGRVWNSVFWISEFFHRAWVQGLIWGFWKIQMAKLSCYILLVI
jgi:hypothetical protein